MIDKRRTEDGTAEVMNVIGEVAGRTCVIADDIIDVEGSEESAGKKVGKDAAAGKATFVSILGLERARAQADLLARQAAQHLEPFGKSADLLIQAANFVVTRRA